MCPRVCRLMLALLLCGGAARSLPQDSDVTFVRIQPVVSDEAPPAAPEDERLVRLARQDAAAELADAETDAPEPEEATESERTTSPRTTPARAFPKPARPAQPSPRFISKLSSPKVASSAGNLVDRPAKEYRRAFKSRCRCEKIWNCPKLQITVPRCPDEYFLCCF